MLQTLTYLDSKIFRFLQTYISDNADFFLIFRAHDPDLLRPFHTPTINYSKFSRLTFQIIYTFLSLQLRRFQSFSTLQFRLSKTFQTFTSDYLDLSGPFRTNTLSRPFQTYNSDYSYLSRLTPKIIQTCFDRFGLTPLIIQTFSDLYLRFSRPFWTRFPDLDVYTTQIFVLTTPQNIQTLPDLHYRLCGGCLAYLRLIFYRLFWSFPDIQPGLSRHFRTQPRPFQTLTYSHS